MTNMFSFEMFLIFIPSFRPQTKRNQTHTLTRKRKHGMTLTIMDTFWICSFRAFCCSC